MSWKFGGIYIKPGFENPEEALHFLQVDKRFTYKKIHFSDVVNSSFADTAIGTLKNVTLVHDNLLPYNNSYEADTYTEADFRMIQLSKTAEMIVFFLDGISGSYGLNHFRAGERTRRYAVMGGQVILKEGNFTGEGEMDNETKMMKWMQEFTGISFVELVNNTGLDMYCFTETGF
jgi:hypothetical protein